MFSDEHFPDLIDRLVNGDTYVLEHLLTNIRPQIHRFFTFHTRNLSEDPSDLTQEFVLRILELHKNGRYPLHSKTFTSYQSYLYQIARTMLREAARRERGKHTNGNALYESLDVYSNILVAPPQIPETNNQMTASLWSAVKTYWNDKLSKIDQQIIEARWLVYPSKPFNEIATELGSGWTSVAVRKRHQRILERTRHHFGDTLFSGRN